MQLEAGIIVTIQVQVQSPKSKVQVQSPSPKSKSKVHKMNKKPLIENWFVHIFLLYFIN